MGKEEIAHNEQFLLFPQCFLLNQITESQFVYIFDIISLFAAEFKKPKIGISGKGLRNKCWFPPCFLSENNFKSRVLPRPLWHSAPLRLKKNLTHADTP